MCLKSAERYDPHTDTWEYIANMNLPRRALTVATLPDGIYAIGGFDGFNYLPSVEKYVVIIRTTSIFYVILINTNRYDETLNEWTFISSMNVARCTLSAVTSNDNQYIYVLGGFNGNPLDSVER